MVRFLLCVAVGLCVSAPVVCFFAGGVSEGLTLMLLSIICTAGIALVVWVPVWWVIGWLLLAIVDLIRSKQPKEKQAGDPKLRDEVLVAYLREADARGMDQQTATSRLTSMGWSIGEIELARQRVKVPVLAD